MRDEYVSVCAEGLTPGLTSATTAHVHRARPRRRRRRVARARGDSDEPPLEVRRKPGQRERDHEEDGRDAEEDLERVDLAEADRRSRRDPLALALARLQQLEAADHARERR